MGGARAQKATKGDMAAASSRNAARQPRGPATNPPNMYPCQTTRGSVTLAAMHLFNLLLLLVLVVHDVPARPGKVHLQTSCRYRLPKSLDGLARSKQDPINRGHILSIVPFQGEGESSLQEDALERILQVDRLKGHARWVLEEHAHQCVAHWDAEVECGQPSGLCLWRCIVICAHPSELS